MQVKKYIEPMSRQKLMNQIYHLDLEARSACISFLQEQYPVISRDIAEKLIHLIFENNFKFYFPNHFGLLHNGCIFGYPFIWLLNELEVGGIQYLYHNGIWQIHWDAGDRYEGIIRRDQRKTIKFLLTTGPIDEKEQQVWQEHGLIFFAYADPAASIWQYPFPENSDLSCNTEFLLSLKLAAHN